MFEGLRADIRRPATWIGVLLGILPSFAISYYFYQKSITVGKLYYQTQQVLVFDQHSLGGSPDVSSDQLFVVDKNGSKIEKNIYAATIKFWNAGNDEVKKEDVRIPFKIDIASDATIVNSSIYNVTMNNIDNFQLTSNTNIGWEHFDPDQGVAIRLIYAAKDQKKMGIKGYAVKSLEPVDVKTEGDIIERTAINMAKWISGGLVLSILIWILYRLYRLPSDKRRIFAGEYLLPLVVSGLLGGLNLFGLLWLWFFFSNVSLTPAPPF